MKPLDNPNTADDLLEFAKLGRETVARLGGAQNIQQVTCIYDFTIGHAFFRPKLFGYDDEAMIHIREIEYNLTGGVTLVADDGTKHPTDRGRCDHWYRVIDPK